MSVGVITADGFPACTVDPGSTAPRGRPPRRARSVPQDSTRIWVGARRLVHFPYSHPRPAWVYPKILVLGEIRLVPPNTLGIGVTTHAHTETRNGWPAHDLACSGRALCIQITPDVQTACAQRCPPKPTIEMCVCSARFLCSAVCFPAAWPTTGRRFLGGRGGRRPVHQP